MLHYLDVILFLHTITIILTLIVEILSFVVFNRYLKEEGIYCPTFACFEWKVKYIVATFVQSLIPVYNLCHAIKQIEFACSSENQDEEIMRGLKDGIYKIKR